MRVAIALVLVGLAQALSLADRQILAILAPRIRDDLGVGNAEMGLLYGTMFGLFYAVFSLPLGHIADTWVRKKLLAACVAGWSLTTLATGFASNYAQIALARLGLGLGEAGAQPAGVSLLTDVLPAHRRGLVGAMLGASVALGLGGALWLGGWVADAWDARGALGEATWGIKGWQAAFICASLPGFVVAALLLLLREPPRRLEGVGPLRGAWLSVAAVLPLLSTAMLARLGASRRALAANVAGLGACIALGVACHSAVLAVRPAGPALFTLLGWRIDSNLLQWTTFSLGLYALVSWLQGLRVRDDEAHAVIARARPMQVLFAIVALQMVVNYGVMAWTATLLVKHYGQTAASTGFNLGMLIATTGVAGPILAGLASDALERRRANAGLAVTAASISLSGPLMYLTYTAADARSFYLGFAVYSLVLTMWLPPLLAKLLDGVLPRVRGVTTSLYVLITTVFGLGLGPYLVGLVSDVRGGDLGGALLATLFLYPVLVALSLAALIPALRPADRG